MNQTFCRINGSSPVCRQLASAVGVHQDSDGVLFVLSQQVAQRCYHEIVLARADDACCWHVQPQDHAMVFEGPGFGDVG